MVASYATGNADGGSGNNDYVGGLTGYNDIGAAITASYATGNADGGAGNTDAVGKLIGVNLATHSQSYGFGDAIDNEKSNGPVDGTPPDDVISATDLTYNSSDATTYAGSKWNIAAERNAWCVGFWNDGNSSSSTEIRRLRRRWH